MTSVAELQLNDKQLGYARGIVAAVRRRNLERRVAVIAIETALTESGLRMYANANNAQSLALPHDAVGQDHASLGLFQQQPQWWGTTAELMNAGISTNKFLDALVRSGWAGKTNWQAAQAVQNSAFADGSNYRANDARATEIVNALWAAPGPVVVAGAHPDYVVRPGDTLTAIAARYPEPQITAQSIAAANVDRFPSLATNINLIRVGWKLRIR